jgi:hypothetical protein
LATIIVCGMMALPYPAAMRMPRLQMIASLALSGTSDSALMSLFSGEPGSG